MVKFRARGIFVALTAAVLYSITGAAQGGRPARGADHTARQDRPISLGVSGGNSNDIANGYCCSGTLGALVQDSGGNKYILSNTHVFAGDFVNGGNGKVAAAGDDINQSGLIDVGCRVVLDDMVADLSDWAAIPSSANVDAAIAASRGSGVVKDTGDILEIGTIANTTAAAVVGQAVKKSGRTTGLTRSSVSGLNATISIGYSDECAGGSFSKTYTGQILISNKGSKFLNSGDSGSLMVEDAATNPRAVGLLYAGSSTIAVANPIDDVLAFFAHNTANTFTMVGGAASISAAAAAAENGPGSARGLARAIAVQERHGRELLSVPGAVGHAVGVGNSPVIKVLVRELTPRGQAAAPRQLEGFPVVLEEVGDVKGMPFCSKRVK